MDRRAVALVVGLAVLALMLVSISPSRAMLDDRKEPGSGMDVRYQRVAFDGLDGWAEDDHAAALLAFRRSCRSLKAAGNGRRARITAGLEHACSAARGVEPGQARAFFERAFRPYRVDTAEPDGFLTGYYEPVLDGALERRPGFEVAILRRPPDLVDLVDQTLRAAANDRLSAGRRRGGAVEAYFTRAEIENGALDGRGLELLYLADPVDAFFMHVQGSGRIRLAEGGEIRIGFDGKNGHPYTSIGGVLLSRAVAKKEEISLDYLRRYIAADRERGRLLMQENKSYIFFRRHGETGEGPIGAQGVALTDGRSLAVDASYHVLGTPIFVRSDSLRHHGGDGFARLMVAQDVGSAIKGPERGDIFWGSGQEAERLAGETKHRGAFVVLLPRDAAP